MLCQECNERQATLHFTKIINGEKTEIHICDVCAKEKGDHIPGSKGFSIHQLLSGLLDFEQPVSHPTSQGGTSRREALRCPSCEMTYDKFAQIGRFGCADCYKTFQSKLDPIFKRIHSGNVVHGGKVPKRIGKDLHLHKEIEKRKQELQALIAKEEFEQAAELRDRIRSLEKSLAEKKEG
ncbi:UvrB/UvrC motif-containing protein [Alteribacter aurantiacus]|uniref:UvrB/UvrC motif-containing protein n=1 Tax=Alteribacter aurantiacus TaxID=254410 RepID=UPI0003F85E6E|nr:UvrB/UvrC motif-containing protein [Alteribacter aurantiacus]